MSNSELEFITIGRILAPWGVRGKLKVKTETDFPQRFVSGAKVYIDQQPMTIDSAEWRSVKLVVKLNTVDSIAEAQELCGKTLEIERKQVQPLDEGQYYHFQIIGLEVWTTSGERLGTISEIMNTESTDIYVVRHKQGEVLIPAIEDVIKSVDLDEGKMVIEPIEGLLNLNQKASK